MKLTTRFIPLALTMFVALASAMDSNAQTQTGNDNGRRATTSENKPGAEDSSPSRLAKPESVSPAVDKGKAEPARTAKTDGPAPKSESAASSNSSQPAPASSTDEWHFRFSPYFWIAGLNGRAGIGNLEVKVDSGLTDPNVHLNFGFMGTLEARRDKLIVLTDLQYSNLGTERPNPGILFSSAEAKFKTFVLDPEVGYRVAENQEKGRAVDILGGVRYWHLRTELNFAAGVLSARSATASRGWADAVVGVRGRMNLTPKLFILGKGDVGGGGAKIDYQLFGAFGFQISEKVALLGGYRGMHVNYHKDNFLFDTTIHGPIFGLSWQIK